MPHMSCAQANARLIAAMPRPVAELSGPMKSATDWRTPKISANTAPAARMKPSWRRVIVIPRYLLFASDYPSRYTFKVQVTRRSTCPAACALDLAGDRWTLLIVRDLLRGRDTFGKLAASDEGIPTNILADRLKRMEQAGMIEAKPYQQRPVRYAYSLTEKGRDLGDVLAALARWGKKHVRGTVVPPEFRRRRSATHRA